jgi:Protein of unknown function (DUF1326)
MVSYDISGTFYEACDCEVICPCWAGLPPDMGSCTGLFAWDISNGNIGGTDVSGSKFVVLSSGASCDDSKYMLVLIDGHSTELKSAFESDGPWKQVFQAQPSPTDTDALRSTQDAIIKISSNQINITNPINIKYSNITKAQVNFTDKPVSITGSTGGNLLIDRVVGSATDKSVMVGVVDTPIDPTQNGLNLLADIPGKYTFDLDISRVTAMRGQFHYVQA